MPDLSAGCCTDDTPTIEKNFLSRVQIDLIDMRHVPDQDKNYIGHVVDHFSKYHVLFPLGKKSASEVASAIEERVLAYLGLPKIFHSDNGREFVNAVLKAIFELLGGDTVFVRGRARHSQSQGCVERGNRTVEDMISKLVKEGGYNNSGETSYPWGSWLPRIMYSLNARQSETTKETPFDLVFGVQPRGNIFPGARAGVLSEDELDDCIIDTSTSENDQYIFEKEVCFAEQWLDDHPNYAVIE